MDDGYDTTISKNNIHKLCTIANIDLRVIKPAEQYNALILAYLEAGVLTVALPQDNTLFAYLYDEIFKFRSQILPRRRQFCPEMYSAAGAHAQCTGFNQFEGYSQKFGKGRSNKLKFVRSYRKYWLLKTKRMVGHGAAELR